MISEHALTILARLSNSADARAGNPLHCWRVATYVASMLDVLGTTTPQRELILAAARVHDIGLLGLPEQILAKPGVLSADERTAIRSHAQRGADSLSVQPESRLVGKLVLHHHERVDGQGYPDGLKGEAIPFGSRVIAVAEAFDSITHSCPCRSGLSVSQAMTVLANGAGTQWDYAIVEAFLTRSIPELVRQGRL